MSEQRTRIYTPEELKAMPHGYGWEEVRPEPGENRDPEDYMMQIAWIGTDTLEVDYMGVASNGYHIDLAGQFDGREYRIWTEKPTEKQRKEAAWID